MELKKIYLITNAILISILVISLNTANLKELEIKNENNSLLDTLKDPNFNIAQATGDANIDHNFVDKFSFTFGSNPNDSVRAITIGYPHPDGILRLLIGSSQKTNGSLHVLKQAGDPFNYVKEGEYIYSTEEWSYLEPMICFDFDEDGIDEILTYCYLCQPYEFLFLGWNGTGYYPKWENIASQMPSSWQAKAQIFDINRDGKPELIVNSFTSTDIFSWDEGFTDFSHDASLIGGAEMNVGIGDIDNDGEVEIITSMAGSDSSIRIWGFNGSDYIQEYINYYSGHERGFSSILAIDINNDDRLEIIAGTPNWALPSYPIVLFEWDGFDLVAYNLTQDTAAHYDILGGDIDGDGLDEVVIDRNGGDTTVVELASNGSIVLQSFSELSIYMWIELYDLDGDYIPEIIAGPQGYSTITLIYQDDVQGPPVLIDVSPSSITVEQYSNINYNVSWVPIDRQSLTYSLYWEDTKFIGPVSCLSGKPIKYNLYSRTDTIGTFNLTLVVNDTDLNEANHSVFITVVSPEPPIISDVISSPINPNPGNIITIRANITDLTGISSATLHYNIDSGAVIDIPLQWQFDDLYQVEIGPFSLSQVISYSISATDNTSDQNRAIDDNSGLFYSFIIVDTIGPTITNVYHSPSDPIAGESINVYADIEDETGISAAELYLQIDNQIGWTIMPMSGQGGTTYGVSIGSFPEGTEIRYLIKAYDTSDSNNEAINDNEGNYFIIYIPFLPESSTQPTSSNEETSEEEINSETSEPGPISINAPINLTGLELVMLAIGAVLYRKNKHKR
ncbi:MAG: FG-GAP-like repeat-containing protein [Promethearchaeota archaeon]